MSKSVVAIVGAPNVGKSTIFNRMIGERHAIVDDEPGITRDRLYGTCTWQGVTFSLIDTGGIEIKDAPFQKQIRMQAEIAIDEADVIVFVVNGQTGITADDRLIAKMLYKVKKPIILAVNKIDEGVHIGNASPFYSLGLGHPYPVSGAHGVGIGDILDEIIKHVSTGEDDIEEDVITFSLVGRPNVGKSSLANAMLNQERNIVSDISGTTRDSIDSTFSRNGTKYKVIDTAGLKKKGKIYEAIDKYSAIRALKAIERSEIVCLVLDADTGIIEQDKHVIQYATDLHKAIIIIVNKWDLIERHQDTMDEFTKYIRREYKFLDYAPIVYVSAKNKTRINTIFDELERVHSAYYTRISTSILNQVMQEAQIMNPSPDFNGGRVKIYYASQVSVAPPTIVLFVNNREWMHFSYLRFIENRLRETFDFDGTPINLVVKNRRDG